MVDTLIGLVASSTATADRAVMVTSQLALATL